MVAITGPDGNTIALPDTPVTRPHSAFHPTAHPVLGPPRHPTLGNAGSAWRPSEVAAARHN